MRNTTYEGAAMEQVALIFGLGSTGERQQCTSASRSRIIDKTFVINEQ